MGIAAVMSTVNFGGTDTLVNPHGRPLKGFTPGRLTSAQADELERKRVNYFATIGPQSIYTPGTTGASGVWRDSQYFLDWLARGSATAGLQLHHKQPDARAAD